MECGSASKFGDYVVLSPRANGLVEAAFVIPRDLLADGWPERIRLPELGADAGSLDDERYCAAVAEDAQRLRDRLAERRVRQTLGAATSYTLPVLAEIYYKRSVYTDLSPERRAKYASNIRLILRWSEARGHPDVRRLSEMDVDDFLLRFRDQDAKRIDLRTTWSILFKTAIYAGWITQTPISRGGWTRKPSRQVMIWSREDVDRYTAEARRQGQPGLAALIETLFVTGQRIGDMTRTRWDKEFIKGRFLFSQSKTGQVVNIPVPEQLLELLESVRVEGSPFIFIDSNTGTPFTPVRWNKAFIAVRDAISAPQDRVLQLKGLRHSCVCQMFQANSSLPEIAGVTGHLLARVHSILEKYTPDRHGMAMSGMKKAHIARGGSEADFEHVGPAPLMDSRGRVDPRNYWELPGQAFLEKVIGREVDQVGYNPDPEVRAKALVGSAYR